MGGQPFVSDRVPDHRAVLSVSQVAVTDGVGVLAEGRRDPLVGRTGPPGELRVVAVVEAVPAAEHGGKLVDQSRRPLGGDALHRRCLS